LADPDVNGVKTGFTNKAGRCLIASMFKDGHQFILVGLNVRDPLEQATQLLRYGEAALRAAAR
jgi:D-alanyl-D-alanine carboxypeptidase (penicillin-binding protein 5/6)